MSFVYFTNKTRFQNDGVSRLIAQKRECLVYREMLTVPKLLGQNYRDFESAGFKNLGVVRSTGVGFRLTALRGWRNAYDAGTSGSCITTPYNGGRPVVDSVEP
jgi:hypothetical protein